MFFVGVDLGQRRDFTAIAVVERCEAAPGFDHVHWQVRDGLPRLVVRYVERMRLGTPYTDVVRRVVEVARHGSLAAGRRLVVDATGVGMPVVDMLRAARPGCEIVPVTITGGAAEHSDGRMWHVPKLDLLAGVQGRLERGELRISRRMREAGTLVRELVDVRLRATAGGRQRLGADGPGEHDDLVIAVALACWSAGKAGVGERNSGRLV